MIYQANLMCNGQAIASRDGNDSNKLLAWVLTQLEMQPVPDDMVGVLRNTINVHEKPRVFTAHNAHFD